MQDGLLGYPLGGAGSLKPPLSSDDPLWRLAPALRPARYISPYDDTFEDGRLLPKWTLFNWSTSFASLTFREKGFLFQVTNGGGTNCRGLEVPLLWSRTKFDVRVRMYVPVWNANNYNQMGVYVRNSTSGRAMSVERFDFSSNRRIGMRPWNSPTSLQAQINEVTADTLYAHVHWFRIYCDGTTITAYASADGIHWFQIGSNTQALATHLVSANRCGIFVDNSSGGVTRAYFDEFRMVPVP